MTPPAWLYRLSSKANLSERQSRELFKIFLYAVTGLVVVAAHWLCMWVLIQLGVAYLAATSIGFLAGAATRFYLSYKHVFEPQATVPRAGVRFMVALGMQFVLNGAIFSLLVYLSVPVWPAQITTSALLVGLNYLMYRIWVFS